jgi:class 3 adenylate cyclase
VVEPFTIVTSVLLVVLLAVLLRSFLASYHHPPAGEIPEPLARELANLIKPLDLTIPRVKGVAVMVVNLPDYAALSRSLPLESLFRVLNHYYQVVTEVADRQFGEILNPASGEIFVIFGRIMPVERPLHVAAACALEIVSKLTGPLQVPGGEKCRGAAAAVGFGEAMSGPIGTERRRTYATVGPVIDEVIQLARRVAPGEVLAPADVVATLGSSYRTEPLSEGGSGAVRIVGQLTGSEGTD